MKSNIEKLEFLFIAVFFMIMAVPFLLARHDVDRISEYENRYYANFPSFEKEGRFNQDFPAEFEAWINDNVRFRTSMMSLNAKIQYYVFHRIAREDEMIGLENELYLMPSSKIQQIRQSDYLSEEDIRLYCEKIQKLKDYLAERDISFYYMQCYNKETIYPEYAVQGISFTEDINPGRKVVDGLKKQTDVTVIPVYETLINGKSDARVYYKVKDSGHWNERGAFLVYEAMMGMIRQDYPDVRKASESDYDLKIEENLRNLYGLIYPYPEDSIVYTLRDEKAVEYDFAEEDPYFYGRIDYKEHIHFFKNEEAGNSYKVLLIGDSFIRQYIKNDIAEHFQKTLSIDWINISKMKEIIEIYQPDIVLLESDEDFLGTVVRMIHQWDAQ